MFLIKKIDIDNNFFMLLITVLKLNFKLKIDPKTCTFKILEEIQKTSLKPVATFP